MRRALEIAEKSLGPDHLNVAIGLNNLALLLRDTNRIAEAEPLMRRALNIDEKSFRPDHPNVAIRLNNLASLLQATNRLDEAEPLFHRAVKILAVSLGNDHPNTKVVANNYRFLLRKRGASRKRRRRRSWRRCGGSDGADLKPSWPGLSRPSTPERDRETRVTARGCPRQARA